MENDVPDKLIGLAAAALLDKSFPRGSSPSVERLFKAIDSGEAVVNGLPVQAGDLGLAELREINALGGFSGKLMQEWHNRGKNDLLNMFLCELHDNPKWRRARLSYIDTAQPVALGAREAMRLLRDSVDEDRFDITLEVPGRIVEAWMNVGAKTGCGLPFFVPHPDVLRLWHRANDAGLLPVSENPWEELPPSGAILFPQAKQFRMDDRSCYLRGLIYTHTDRIKEPFNTMATFIFTCRGGMIQQGIVLNYNADECTVHTQSSMSPETSDALLREMEGAFHVLSASSNDNELLKELPPSVFWGFGEERSRALKELLDAAVQTKAAAAAQLKQEQRRAAKAEAAAEAERVRAVEAEAAARRAQLKREAKAQTSPQRQRPEFDVAALRQRLAQADWAILEEAGGWAAYSSDPAARPVRIDDRVYDAGTWEHLMNRLRKAGWSEPTDV